MNTSRKNQDLQEVNPESESIHRILKFVMNNKPIFEKYGFTKLLEKPRNFTQNPHYFNNNLKNNAPIQYKNENLNNLVIKSAVRGDKEMLSMLAGKKIIQVAM